MPRLPPFPTTIGSMTRALRSMVLSMDLIELNHDLTDVERKVTLLNWSGLTM